MVKNAAGVVLVHKGGLLLQQRQGGMWDLPGGHLEPGESLEDCAIRETLEETGLQVDGLALLGVASGKDIFVQDAAGHKTFYVTALYQARGFRGTLQHSQESLQVGFFELQALPEPCSRAVQGVLPLLKGSML